MTKNLLIIYHVKIADYSLLNVKICLLISPLVMVDSNEREEIQQKRENDIQQKIHSQNQT